MVRRSSPEPSLTTLSAYEKKKEKTKNKKLYSISQHLPQSQEGENSSISVIHLSSIARAMDDIHIFHMVFCNLG